jgi:hypothetical protein
MDNFKKWLLDQAEVAKFAWTVVLVIAGLWGYRANLTPIEKGDNAQATLELRVAAIEQLVKTDPHVQADAVEKVLILEKQLADIKKTIEGTELPPPVPAENRKPAVYPFTIEPPKVQ